MALAAHLSNAITTNSNIDKDELRKKEIIDEVNRIMKNYKIKIIIFYIVKHVKSIYAKKKNKNMIEII